MGSQSTATSTCPLCGSNMQTGRLVCQVCAPGLDNLLYQEELARETILADPGAGSSSFFPTAISVCGLFMVALGLLASVHWTENSVRGGSPPARVMIATQNGPRPQRLATLTDFNASNLRKPALQRSHPTEP